MGGPWNEQAKARVAAARARKAAEKEAAAGGYQRADYSPPDPAASAAGDRPPTGTKAPKRPPVGAPTKRRGQALARKITELVHFTAGIVSLRDQFDGAMLAAGAPKLGETWGAVIERHPKLLQALEQFEQGGVYGAAAIATLTIALPIAAHHRMLPAPLVPLAQAMIPHEVMVRMQTAGQGPQDAAAAANGAPAGATVHHL